MFSWFKAKTPKSVKKWEILKNGKGEYFVKYVLIESGVPPGLYSENMYFKDKVFANEIQCETAIKEYENERKLKKKTHVKYI